MTLKDITRLPSLRGGHLLNFLFETTLDMKVNPFLTVKLWFLLKKSPESEPLSHSFLVRKKTFGRAG